jgi:hypothetical protein
MNSAADLDERWARRFNATQRRLELKERAVAYKGGSCCLCGYDRCLRALAFHHLDPESKDFEISAKMRWALVKAELDKTILVCSNCHHEVHSGLYPSLLGGCLEEGSSGVYNELEGPPEE